MGVPEYTVPLWLAIGHGDTPTQETIIAASPTAKTSDLLIISNLNNLNRLKMY